jgi:hypothetical protein
LVLQVEGADVLTIVELGDVKLPRKSRHLDLTREEASDAESRAEEN